MGKNLSCFQRKETKNTCDDTLRETAIYKPILTEKFSDLPKTWNPAFNEFQFGDNIESINTKLPIQFASLNRNDMPQADEFPDDIVKYFWLTLSNFGDRIDKFIPPDTTVNENSYVCFLFVHEKLFKISIRLFFDGKHRSYDDIIQAYAKVVNTPIIETKLGKEFYYEDQRIIYCAYFHSDQSHVIIDVIRKDQTKTDIHTYAHFNTHEKRIQSPEESLIFPQPYKYDIMISYSHKEKDFAHRLYHRLIESNYRVWIDLENMYGPIVERMAEAIENSEFVLLCVSNAYKSSTYCRLEAEYAFKVHVCLIPVVVKQDFTQTGWLGMLCGLRLQINFDITTFDDAYEKLCTEIQRYRTNKLK